MTPGRKKMVDAIMVKIGGGKPSDDEEASESKDEAASEDEGAEAQFDALRDALETGDAKSGVAAIKAICGY